MSGAGPSRTKPLRWHGVALERLASGVSVALVTILATEGSTPREAGTRMLAWPGGQWGTIGGGALERLATDQARRMLESEGGPCFAVQDYPLGPLLAQCCGGRVRLMIERLGENDRPWLAKAARQSQPYVEVALTTRLTENGVSRRLEFNPEQGPAVCVNGVAAQARGPTPSPGDVILVRDSQPNALVRLFGAGHVGKAIAGAIAPLPLSLDWRDSREAFATPVGARCQPPEELARAAAEPSDFTLVMTHDHGLDYALTRAALSRRNLAYVGLIGSATKRARFLRRLRDEGFEDDALAKLTCPIGLPGLAGKAPAIIAASVAADLLIRLERRTATSAPCREPALAGL